MTAKSREFLFRLYSSRILARRLTHLSAEGVEGSAVLDDHDLTVADYLDGFGVGSYVVNSGSRTSSNLDLEFMVKQYG